MNKTIAKAVGAALALILMFVLMVGKAEAISKKLKVNLPGTSIFLDPDGNSSVIAVLNQGDLVTIASTRLFRKKWFYVYFTAPGSTVLKSGYLLKDAVTRLYKDTTVHTIDGGRKRPQHPGPGEFTRVRWGIHSRDILRRADPPVDRRKRDGETILVYEGRALDRSCRIGYVFNQSRLSGRIYQFEASEECLNEYRRIKSILNDRIGRPNEDLAVWKTEGVQDDESLWEHAVLAGNLTCRSSWRAEGSMILLRLGLDEAGVSLAVEMTQPDITGVDHPAR